MPTGGEDQKRYEKNRLRQQQAKLQATKKAGAGSSAGSKTAGRIKGGDLFNRKKSTPSNLANQKKKGVAGAKTAGRIKGGDLFKRPQPAQQPQPPQQLQPDEEELAQQEANKMTSEDVANRAARVAASGVETGAAAVETGAAAAQGAAAAAQGTAAVAQGAAKGAEVAAKGAQMAAKGVGAASQATGAASKALTSAGQALSATGLGSIVGVPLMALGGAGTAASAGGKAAAKGGEVAAKGAEKGAKAAGEAAKKTKEGAKKAKEGAKKVKEGAKKVKGQAKQAKGLLDQQHGENKKDKLDNARAKVGNQRPSRNGAAGDENDDDPNRSGGIKKSKGIQSLDDRYPTRARKQLADMRQGVKDQGKSRTGFELDRKEAGIKDPDIKNELLRDSKGAASDLSDQAEENFKRKAALYGSRLAAKLGAHKTSQGLSMGAKQVAPDAKSSKAGLEGMDPKDRLQQNKRTLLIERGKLALNKRQQQQANKSAPSAKETEETRDEVKKEAKAAIRRGIAVLLDLLASALDLGTGGVAYFVDFFMHAFSLSWLNLEMIYGRWIAKGKSKYIAPISWAPIKMPVDKTGIILQFAVLTADALFLTSIVVLTFGSACFMYDYVMLITQPKDFIIAAEAGGEGLCFGAILAEVLKGL